MNKPKFDKETPCLGLAIYHTLKVIAVNGMSEFNGLSLRIDLDRLFYFR